MLLKSCGFCANSVVFFRKRRSLTLLPGNESIAATEKLFSAGVRVLDTNILIYYSRRETIVSEKVEQWLRVGPLLVSTVVEAEVLAWSALDAVSLLELQEILKLFNIIPVDSVIAQTAAALARTYKIELLDAFIAATALRYQAPLVTRNVKDFAKIKEITIEKL